MKQTLNQQERLWTLHHVKIKPHEQIAVHKRNEWELSYIIKGQGERVLETTRNQFFEHDLALVVPGAEHGWIFDPQVTDSDGNIECISLQWPIDLFERLEQIFPALGKVKSKFLEINHCAVFDASKSHSLIDKFILLDQCEETDFPMLLLDLFNTILKEYPLAERIERKKLPSKTEIRISQIEIYTSCNYARHITLDDVSRHVGMNRSSFCTFFRRVMGDSYLNYLNRHRLKVARQLIEQNNDSISSICWQCGFNDLGYFDRLFRRVYGISPSECRVLN
ncbi:MAG: helix-turn-helix domain-containing protein [Bacteroidales bacterium]|nr:helix-turn-helix domain-containing protein [Bacteroidales bacterium]